MLLIKSDFNYKILWSKTVPSNLMANNFEITKDDSSIFLK